jgi:hypothetical protein
MGTHKREFVPITGNMGFRSGRLRDVLKQHARERAEHFFLFLFAYKALTDRMNEVHGEKFGHHDHVTAVATDQIADGQRRDEEVYISFKKLKKAEDILDVYATEFQDTDAAHFNNLGTNDPWRAKASQHAQADGVCLSLFTLVKMASGNTRQLPANVNTGGDKVVDNCHIRLYPKMLDGKPPLTPANMAAYVAECRQAIEASRQRHLARGNLGVAALRGRYLAFYDDREEVGAAFDAKRNTIWAECGALGLNPGRYVSSMVA